MSNPEKKKKREYLIEIQKWRSVIALMSCIITYVLSIFAIVASLIMYTRENWNLSDFFRYFTTLSNMVTGISAGFIIPFAINGIRKKRFVYPHWLSMMHYTGTIATTMTMIFTLVFILPFDPEFALGDYNFFLHIICPIAILISFQLVEFGRELTRRDSLVCLIPFFLYTWVYLIMVVFIGKENGGWEDLYMLNTFVPFYISMPLVWILAYFIAFLIRLPHNSLVKIRKEKLRGNWSSDLEPVEIGIEIYGLGRYNGLTGEKSDLIIPYDILEIIADKYSIKIETLVKAYTKGLISGVKELSDLRSKSRP